MRSAGLNLLFSVVTGTLAAQPAEPAPPPMTSARLLQEIRATLPKFAATEAKPAATTNETAAPAPDPDVLVLPKISVKEKRLPSDAADYLMGERAFDRKMANLYYDTIAADGPLNVLLNQHAIPIINKISIPLPPRRGQTLYRSVESVRGQEIYRAREVERLEHVAAIHKDHDPEAETKFKQEIDNTHTTRPAGH